MRVTIPFASVHSGTVGGSSWMLAENLTIKWQQTAMNRWEQSTAYITWEVLDNTKAKYDNMVLAHGGGTRGVELIAAKWAKARAITTVIFRPDWKKHNRAAPFKRNDQIARVKAPKSSAVKGKYFRCSVVNFERKHVKIFSEKHESLV